MSFTNRNTPEPNESDDSDSSATRRAFLGALAGVTGAIGGYAFKGSDTQEALGIKSFEIWTQLYEQNGGGQIPTHDALRTATKVPENPSAYITPEDSVVEKYAEQSDLHIDTEKGLGTLAREQAPIFTYERDISQFDESDRWMMPKDYLKSGVGDCEDYALAMASVMEALGYPARVVTGTGTFDGDTGLHAMTETRIGGEHYALDVSFPQRLCDLETYEQFLSDWKPLTMFGADTEYQTYDEDW